MSYAKIGNIFIHFYDISNRDSLRSLDMFLDLSNAIFFFNCHILVLCAFFNALSSRLHARFAKMCAWQTPRDDVFLSTIFRLLHGVYAMGKV